MDCNTCNKRPDAVPYLVHEGILARFERTVKRLWILVLILILLLVGTNVAWLIYESQFEDVSVTQDVDTGEGDAFVAGYGDVIYGESETDSKSP